jgi:RNA polymerase sigma factor (sigma-70 family)
MRRPVALLRRVVAGDPDAWMEFVEKSSGFLYALAWRYARGDVDVASELVLVALEGLRRPDTEGRPFYRLRSYLDSLDRFGSRSRFVTWLALVTKNLFRDWYREHEGRRLLPKEIEGLGGTERRIFKLLFWEGKSEEDAFEELKTDSPLSLAQFEQGLEKVMDHLSEKNLLTIYRDLLRRLPVLSLDADFSREGSRRLEIADPRPQSRPDKALELAEDRKTAAKLRKLLEEAIQSLPQATRNVLLFHAIQGFSGEEIRKIMHYKSRQRVYDELAKARRKMLKYLKNKGVGREQVRRAEGFLDGIGAARGKKW